MSECIPVAKVCYNCACYEVCIYANPGRKKDCSLWKPDMAWVPVSDMLPEKDGFVLVYTIDQIVGEAILINRKEFYWAGSDDDAEPISVTHWMPLPKPPKEATNV